MDTVIATEVEIVTEIPEQKELLVVVQQNNLLPETAHSLQQSFAPAFQRARQIIEKSRAIVVTSADQKLDIKVARAYRLELKALRVSVDKLRKELKDESLKKGRAIDGFANIFLHLSEGEEQRLQEQEEFAERQEAARKAALKSSREAILIAIQVDPALYQLGEMSDETFNQLVEGTKLARAAAEAARLKAEADRIAKEKADTEERERVRLENEGLKREAAEKEAALAVERERVAKERAEAEAKAKAERDEAERKRQAELAEIKRQADEERARVAAEKKTADDKARAEREAAEAAAKKEREAREKIEREVAAQKAKVEADRLAKEESDRKAAAAPDRAKVFAFAHEVRLLRVPTLTSENAQAHMLLIAQQITKFADWLDKRAGEL